MLNLHCGWPRTSTTSLQTALFENRDRLEAAGIVYPDRWRSKIGLTHHGLSEMLQASSDSLDALDDFTGFLAAHTGEDVLFSAEELTRWMLTNHKQEIFLRFLVAAQQVMPIRCIWTLRRADEFVNSLALLRLKLTGEHFVPDRSLSTAPGVDSMFIGLKRVEEACGGDVVYVKYAPNGTHTHGLLEAFGLPDTVARAIDAELSRGPRLHASLTHKEAVVLANLDALSERAGVDLDRPRVRGLFERAESTFEGDWPCQLMDAKARAEIHQAALSAARRSGISPYVEFFADARSDPSPARPLDPDDITGRDLRSLLAHLGVQEHEPRDGSPTPSM